MTKTLSQSYAAELLNRLLCHLFGHRWHRWEAGHVHAGDDWAGPWHDEHPWFRGAKTCRRCDKQESL